jgi:hypothetical protein
MPAQHQMISWEMLRSRTKIRNRRGATDIASDDLSTIVATIVEFKVSENGLATVALF